MGNLTKLNFWIIIIKGVGKASYPFASGSYIIRIFLHLNSPFYFIERNVSKLSGITIKNSMHEKLYAMFWLLLNFVSPVRIKISAHVTKFFKLLRYCRKKSFKFLSFQWHLPKRNPSACLNTFSKFHLYMASCASPLLWKKLRYLRLLRIKNEFSF